MILMAPARFWIRRQDREHFFSLTFNPLETAFDKYLPLFTGETKGIEELKKYGRHTKGEFVFGAIRPWDEVRDNRCLKVQVEPYTLHPNGLVLTNYSEEDLHFHQPLELNQAERIRRQTIAERTDIERVQFIAGTNFVDAAYKTFYQMAASGRVKTGFTPRLILYDPDGQLDERGNMANPTTADDLPTAIALKKARRRETETFRERI